MKISKYISSSIGKKQIIAFSGLVLIAIFILPHLLGNLQILRGAQAFNGYAKLLHSMGFVLEIIEAFFALMFVVHIVFTIILVTENFRARSIRYKSAIASEPRSFASRMMPYTGAIILLFLVVHLYDFAFAKEAATSCVWRGEDLGLYGMVMNSFANPWRLGGYAFIMLIVGLHLSHALQSALQTLNLRPGRYVFWFNLLSYFLGISVTVGFVSIIIYAVVH